MSNVKLISVGFGNGGPNNGCENGPSAVAHFMKENNLEQGYDWLVPIVPTPTTTIDTVRQSLTLPIFDCLHKHEKFVVVGGDHTIAHATWGAASDYFNYTKVGAEVGLIWIDAHMDSHTDKTSISGNLHGMPLASLMGFGSLSSGRKIHPHNICVIGVRDYEPAEQEMLRDCGVEVITAKELQRIGWARAMRRASQVVTEHSSAFGISIDIDVFDPEFAPGVSVPSAGGFDPRDLFVTLAQTNNHPDFIGLEVAEYNPSKDVNYKTAELVAKLIKAIA